MKFRSYEGDVSNFDALPEASVSQPVQQQVVAQPVATVVAAPAAPVAQTASVPTQTSVQNLFVPKVSASTDELKGVDKATDTADDIIQEVFGQAVVHVVKTDEDVRQQMLDTAKQAVQDRATTIADKTSAEATAQHFSKYEDACGYFGYDEKTTTKFHVDAMAAIIFILNTIYIFSVGMLVVAPIAFILNKLRVVIKKTWLAFVFALIIYLLIVFIPILIAKLTGAPAEAVKPVIEEIQGA